MSDSGIHFLSWVRRGLASLGVSVDPLSGDLPARQPVVLRPRLQGEGDRGRTLEADVSVHVYGPGDVVGIVGQQILPTDPPANTTAFEPNYFVTIEFDCPDLPWLFTPAAPDSQGRLRPWLSLVVVPEEVARIERPDPPRLAVLTCPRTELPDLAESWAWAHAQVTIAATSESIRDVLTNPDNNERNLSRIICPRRLEPNRRYRACLVPAFEAGRLAGLGQPVQNGNTSPAWVLDPSLPADDNVILPVYFDWGFGTSAGGDFESLAGRLRGRHLGSFEIALQIGLSLYPLPPDWPTADGIATDPQQYAVWIDGTPLDQSRYSIAVVDGRLQLNLATAPSAVGRLRVLPRNASGVRLIDITHPGGGMAPYSDDVVLQTGVSTYPLSPEWPTTPLATVTDPTLYTVWIDGALQDVDRYSIAAVDDRVQIILASPPSTAGRLRVSPRNFGGERATIPLLGALRVPETRAAWWDENAAPRDKLVRDLFQTRLKELLRGLPDRLALSPPTYGSIHAGIDPRGPVWPRWLEELNLDPRYRVAAGLGTQVVQQQQERLMELAWQQAAAQSDAQRASSPLGHPLRAANQLVRQGQLAIAAQSASFEKRIGSSDSSARLGNARLLELAAPLTLTARIAQNPVAASAISTAFRCISRPFGPIMRRAERARRLFRPSAVPVSEPTPTVEASLADVFSGQVVPAPSLPISRSMVSLAMVSDEAVTLADITFALPAGPVEVEVQAALPDGVRTSPGAAMHGRRIFVGTDSGRLFELFNDGVRWLWFDHGRLPNNERVSSFEPSAVFDDSRFFLVSENGILFERYWDGDRWVWAEHGVPPGSGGLASAPSRPSVDAQTIAFFFCGRNGQLYEYRHSSEWQWIPHQHPGRALRGKPLAISSTLVYVPTVDGLLCARSFAVRDPWPAQQTPRWQWEQPLRIDPLGELRVLDVDILQVQNAREAVVVEASDGNVWYRPFPLQPFDHWRIVQETVHVRTNAQWYQGDGRKSEFRAGVNGHLIERLWIRGRMVPGPYGDSRELDTVEIFDHGRPPSPPPPPWTIPTSIPLPPLPVSLPRDGQFASFARYVIGAPAYLPGDGVFVTTSFHSSADRPALQGSLGHVWWDQRENSGAGGWRWEDFGAAQDARGDCAPNAQPPQDIQALPLGFLNNLLVAHVDNPVGDNRIYYRLGRNTGFDAGVGRWDEPILAMSEPIGFQTQGLGVAVTDIRGISPDYPETDRRHVDDRRRDLIILHVDNPDGPNTIFHRVGFDLGSDGTVEGNWSPVKQCPFPISSEIQGIDLAVADLDGDGHPELIVAYVTGGPPPHRIFYRIGWRLDNNGDVTRGWTYSQEVPGTPDIVQGVGVAVADMNDDDRRDLVVLTLERNGEACRALYRIGYGLNSRGNIVGGWSEPILVGGEPFGPEHQGAGIIAADFTGSRRPDLLVFTIERRPGGNQSRYRVGWDLDKAGVAASWSESFAIPGWFGTGSQGGAVALADIDDERRKREQMQERFREAARAHQVPVTRAQELAKESPTVRGVPLAALAQEIRVAPSAAIAQRVRARISSARREDASEQTFLQAFPNATLRPFVFTPGFPQPMFEALRNISQEFLFPGAANIPPESVALVTTNADFIESFMVGLNHEFSREMLWRGYPGDRRATFFQQFWDIRGAAGSDARPLTDIEPINSWKPDEGLGGLATAVGGDGDDMLVLLLRGELLRRYPSATIYAQRATAHPRDIKPDGATKRSEFDLEAARRPAQFWGRLEPDLLFFGLPLTVEEACGADGGPGWFIVIQQPPTDARFGLDAVPEQGQQYGGEPQFWRDLHWGHMAADEGGLRELRHLPVAHCRLSNVWKYRTKPDPDREDASMRLNWGLNSAHMAQITYQPPFQIAWHASVLLPA